MIPVSVVIPTHNRAHLLPTALGSVLNQSFRDFEIIIVDDASTDGTAELQRVFDDVRIRWLRHDTARGGAAARNTGIARCHGEYVAFLDDDDEWYPEKLARQTEILAKSGDDVGAVFTGYCVIDAATAKVIGKKNPTKRGDLYADLLEGNCIGGTSCAMVKRTCLDHVGWFDERLPSFQDYDLWLRIARGFRFDCITEPLLSYYVHSKKVWTEPDALSRGLEIMLDKYGQSASFRKYCSNAYVSLGVKFCEMQRIEEGRKAFSNAIALNPYRLQPYWYRCLAWGGLTAISTARSAQARVTARTRRRS